MMGILRADIGWRARSRLKKDHINESRLRAIKGAMIAGSLNTDKSGVSPRDSKSSKLLATHT